ncbi:hypothetical protein Cabys_3644 [Caldithrix abyssi DSM 13497]|uniref:Uncharacterized protein n=1 Tax=Caldithrix abyssi DSM 13497 TaxID=880073 RepID=A0A1J1CCW1_CALAY|nr:hypothetical protein Cabys_3644 [Caldithrix abyssi DSM 13497]
MILATIYLIANNGLKIGINEHQSIIIIRHSSIVLLFGKE